MSGELIDLKDIVIIPDIASPVKSRQECSVTYDDGCLPIFIAPMDTVINSDNIARFTEMGFRVTSPRGVSFSQDKNPNSFYSIGLDEFRDICHCKTGMQLEISYNNFLVDIANGHMAELVTLIKTFKELYPSKKIMVGNIANPKTYLNLAKAGADYVRCCIGTGSACTTSVHTGIHYPIASLIQECRKLKNENNLTCGIIADGGLKTYSDIIKSLALGADYVMIGSIAGKCVESITTNYVYLSTGIKIPLRLGMWLYKNTSISIYNKYRGMSTKEVQKAWGRKDLKAEEGIVYYHRITHSLEQWKDEFVSYLKSSMSYCGCSNLKDYIGEVECRKISIMAYHRYAANKL